MSFPSQNFCLSSSSMKEEVMVNKKQGIVSILGSDCEKSKSASLRRTLSADMSSKKWQAEQWFYPLKKIASSQGFLISIAQSSTSPPSEECDQERPHDAAASDQGQFDVIWSSIQEKKEKNKEAGQQFDMWSSIISQKSTVAGRSDEESNNNNPLPPYVHPLVKRSANCLSGKSLEICTESLGSETGSDSLSSASSETDTDAEDAAAEEENEEISAAQHYHLQVPGDNIPPTAPVAGKKLPPSPRSRSFPPPITSLSSPDGASLHMRPRRNNGSLVLEAVSVPSQNNFRAQRQDGRLVLTFIDTLNQKQADDDEDTEQIGLEFEDSEEKNEISGRDEEELQFVMEQAPRGSGGPISVHRLALVMNNKSLVLAANSSPAAWPNKAAAEGDQPITPLTQSLPPLPPVARKIPSPPAAAKEAKASASFHVNAFEYFWRVKPVAAAVLNPVTQNPASVTTNTNKLLLHKDLMMPNEQQQQQLIVLRGNKADYLVPMVKGCKEPRRVLFWAPQCIATS